MRNETHDGRNEAGRRNGGSVAFLAVLRIREWTERRVHPNKGMVRCAYAVMIALSIPISANAQSVGEPRDDAAIGSGSAETGNTAPSAVTPGATDAQTPDANASPATPTSEETAAPVSDHVVPSETPNDTAVPTTSESATATAAPPRRRHHRRDRWRNTISLGFTVGAASPLGALGMFLEYRPIKWASIAAGGGFGGTFGPAIAGSVYVDPLVVGIFGLGAGVSVSHNFSWFSGEIVPGRRPLPAFTNWVSVELEAQIRPSRGVFLRLGVGRAFLLDTQAFNLGTQQELDAANIPHLPIASPVDAMYSAARHEDFGLWYVHLDVSPTWRL